MILHFIYNLSRMETAKIVLMILGGLGALLVGMEILQQSTEKLATTGLKKLFSKTSKNPFVGLGIGTLATMIMQSSGATTVMVVGFVNAGVMSLTQATAYIMGANIGTTITAQIVALGDLPITPIIISLTLVGILMKMFLNKNHPKVADIGMLIVGLGVLFLGLEVMESNMETLLTDSVTNFLQQITNPFLLLVIGIVTTVAFQSSSAITSIIIALIMAAGYNIFPGNAVLFIILGTNIGSTSTALISSIGSTTSGKRAAMIHLIFNTLGSIIFFIILVCVPNFYDVTFGAWFKSSPQTAIAMFHTFFNVVCTIIFMPLTKFIVKLASIMVPERKHADNQSDIDAMLDERFLENTAIAYSQAVSYYHKLYQIAKEDLDLAIKAFLEKDTSKEKNVDDTESRVLQMTKNLTSFVIKIQALGVSEEIYSKLSQMLLDATDLIRLTEVADNLTGYTNHVVNDDLTFSDIVKEQILQMQSLLTQQFEIVQKIVDEPSLELLAQEHAIEDKVDDLRTEMVHSHMERLKDNICAPENSSIFINLVSNLERCGDHFNFVSERACAKLLGNSDSINLATHA